MDWPDAWGRTTVDSPVGPVLVQAGPGGIERIELGPDLGGGRRSDPALDHVARLVASFFDGSDELLVAPVVETGPAFTRAVRRRLRQVPRGRTVSYGELADLCGRPGAARAVGRAVATNPVALAVPCHRVVRGDGSLGGFAYGTDRKRRLLELEGVT